MDLSSLEKALSIANTVYIAAVVVAAVATFFVYFFASRLSTARDTELRKFQSESAQAIAQANSRGEEAVASAAKANEGMAIAQTNAEQARAQAANALTEQEKLRQENLRLSIKFEEERIARLKIEERLAPRRLTKEQQRTIVGKVLPFSGQKLNLVASTDVSEVVNIANTILSILKEANWMFGTYIGNDMARSVSGILVEVLPGAEDSTKAAAQALASALSAENLAVGGPQPAASNALTGMFTGESIPDAKIRLTVGNK